MTVNPREKNCLSHDQSYDWRNVVIPKDEIYYSAEEDCREPKEDNPEHQADNSRQMTQKVVVPPSILKHGHHNHFGSHRRAN